MGGAASVTGAFRMAWRLQRWEIAFAAVACLGLATVASRLAVDMRSILALCGTPDATPACDLVFAFQETHGNAVGTTQWLISLVPFAVGLVLGVPIVTREVEQRTALIAWPLARARLRWLAWRSAPVLVLAVVLVAPVALAADEMARAYFPHSDIGFVEYHARGQPLITRTAIVFAVGVAIGAIVGRVLSALLIGIGLSVALWTGLAMALPHWVAPTLLGDPESLSYIGSQLSTDVMYRLPGGQLVGADEGEAFTEAAHEAAGGEPDPALLPETLLYGVAPDRYGEVVARETVALLAATAIVFGLGALVVHRRRPE
jgi:hypothetical protein